jgi:hypothetical protein
MWRETREQLVWIALAFAVLLCAMGLLATGGEFLVCMGAAVGVLGLLSTESGKRTIGVGFALLLPLAAYLAYQQKVDMEEGLRQARESLRLLRERAPVAGELTPEVAMAALLERIRASPAGPLSVFDADKLAAVPLDVDAESNIAHWDRFTLDIHKRSYWFSLADAGRKDGHVLDCKGEFVKTDGKWIATEPSIGP